MRMALEMEIEASRMRGRSRRRWTDCIKGELETKELAEENTSDTGKWMTTIRAADPRTVHIGLMPFKRRKICSTRIYRSISFRKSIKNQYIP